MQNIGQWNSSRRIQQSTVPFRYAIAKISNFARIAKLGIFARLAKFTVPSKISQFRYLTISFARLAKFR